MEQVRILFYAISKHIGVNIIFLCQCSLKGVWQVTKEAYESCDITNDPIKEWYPPRTGEEIVVWMDRGQTHYFIDPLVGNCLSGSKLKVRM